MVRWYRPTSQLAQTRFPGPHVMGWCLHPSLDPNVLSAHAWVPNSVHRIADGNICTDQLVSELRMLAFGHIKCAWHINSNVLFVPALKLHPAGRPCADSAWQTDQPCAVTDVLFRNQLPFLRTAVMGPCFISGWFWRHGQQAAARLLCKDNSFPLKQVSSPT